MSNCCKHFLLTSINQMASFSDIPATLPGQTPLVEHDPELYDIIEKEKWRQWSGLELIASENLTSRSVMECLGSCLTNKVYFILTVIKMLWGRGLYCLC